VTGRSGLRGHTGEPVQQPPCEPGSEHGVPGIPDLLPHDFPPPGAVKYYFSTWPATSGTPASAYTRRTASRSTGRS
jgi:hypothetical protein